MEYSAGRNRRKLAIEVIGSKSSFFQICNRSQVTKREDGDSTTVVIDINKPATREEVAVFIVNGYRVVVHNAIVSAESTSACEGGTLAVAPVDGSSFIEYVGYKGRRPSTFSRITTEGLTRLYGNPFAVEEEI